jgi:hypothetical protein
LEKKMASRQQNREPASTPVQKAALAALQEIAAAEKGTELELAEAFGVLDRPQQRHLEEIYLLWVSLGQNGPEKILETTGHGYSQPIPAKLHKPAAKP